LIIDSKKEINDGLAPHFPPVVLNESEILMNSQSFDFLKIGVGQDVNVEIDTSLFFPSLAEGFAPLLAMMSSGMKDGPKFNWRKRTMTIAQKGDNPELEIGFDEAFKSGNVGAPGAPTLPSVIDMKSNITASFSDTYGKFPVAYGNTILMDCHYFFNNIITGLYAAIEPLKKTNFFQWFILNQEIQ